MGQSPTGTKLARLNRLLLERAFPKELGAYPLDLSSMPIGLLTAEHLVQLFFGKSATTFQGASLIEILRNLVSAAAGYSVEYLKHLMSIPKDALQGGPIVPADLRESATSLYDWVERLNRLVRFKDETWQTAQAKHMEEEKKRFGIRTVGKSPHSNAGMPEVFLSAQARENLEGQIDHIEERDTEQPRVWIRALRLLLVELQRKQSEYLMHGLTGKEKLRGRGEILGRMLNYVLVFRPEDSGLQVYFKSRCDALADSGIVGDQPISEKEANGEANDVRELFAAWNSYDLFHYVITLVPIEIQVRTQLSQTMAEQYHNTVYKARPPRATAAQRERMVDIGVELDELDKEMDVLIEDYINHWLDEKDEGKV